MRRIGIGENYTGDISDVVDEVDILLMKWGFVKEKQERRGGVVVNHYKFRGKGEFKVLYCEEEGTIHIEEIEGGLKTIPYATIVEVDSGLKEIEKELLELNKEVTRQI